MIIHTSASLNVKRVDDNVAVQLPTGDALVLSPESAREAGYWLMQISERIQAEQAEARKNARAEGRARG